MHKLFEDLQKELYCLLRWGDDISYSKVLESQINIALEAGSEKSKFANYERLSFFCTELHVVKEADELSFKRLCKNLREAKDDDASFHGHRFELHVAAQLCVRKAKFDKSERPDFQRVAEQDICIECTSSRFRGGIVDYSFMEKN